MTDTHELIAEIETFLELTAKREMFTSTEIQDLLLDLRRLSLNQANGSSLSGVPAPSEAGEANPAPPLPFSLSLAATIALPAISVPFQ